METIVNRKVDELTVKEIVKLAKTRNARLKRMLIRNEVNHYVIFTGLELCRVNDAMLELIERILSKEQASDLEGRKLDSEQSEVKPS